jgi:hypothetical protein
MGSILGTVVACANASAKNGLALANNLATPLQKGAFANA